MNLSNRTWSEAGLKFLGFGHTFLKFPRVIQARLTTRPARVARTLLQPTEYPPYYLSTRLISLALRRGWTETT